MESVINVDLRQVGQKLDLPQEKVQRTVELLDDGNTVPFITRYRKDQTGGLDEEKIRQIQQAVVKLRMLAERKQTILRSIESQGKLTPELSEQINSAHSTKRLEDIYLPYKPKKQTLATVARQRGLEPLAKEVLSADPAVSDLDKRAADFVNPDIGLGSLADVLLGVGHLLAEGFSERADLRGRLRKILQKSGKLVTKRIETPEKKQTEPKAETEKVDKPTSETPPEEQAEAENAASSEAVTSPEPVASSSAPADSPESSALSETTPNTATEAEKTDEAPTQPAAPESQAERPEPTEEAEQSDSKDATEVTETPTEETTPSLSTDNGKSVAIEVTAEEASQPKETQADENNSKEQAPSSKSKQQPKVASTAQKKAPALTKEQRKEEEKKRKKKQIENSFKDYFEFQESLSKLPPHRILAINRGERAKVLRVKIESDTEAMRKEAEELLIPEGHPHADFLRECVRDLLNRLMLPSLEREARREMTEKSEAHAVEVFAHNLRNLLLQPPVHDHRVLAIDPGFRNGCKLAALDEFGNVLGHGVIYLVGKGDRRQRGRKRLAEMIKLHRLTAIAIGNGTACRETEELVADLIADELKGQNISYVIVNEAGASVYSTSPIGREEFPSYDATLRGAISIGRRLLDPLSELVKITPANIGVGMYQHDVKAKHLRNSLDDVVESCVNFVGVDVNAASPALLRYVSGLNQLTARRVYDYRSEHGPFKNREQLRSVPGFGEAAFVQSAGFLKITGGDNPLDATWIHPESYQTTCSVLEKLGSSVDELAKSLVPLKPDVPEPAAEPPAKEAPIAADQNDENTTAISETKAETEDKPPQPTKTSVAIAAESPTEQVAGSGETEAESKVEDPQNTASSSDAASSDVRANEPSVETPAENSAEPTTDDAEEAGSTELPQEPKEADAKTDSPSQSTQPEEAVSDSAEASATAEVAASKTEPDQAVTETLREKPERPKPAINNQLAEKINSVAVSQLSEELAVGELLLKDILASLVRPGRDPREDLQPPIFRHGIMKMEDLEPGMELSGTILNVVDFGAFVDIGLHDSGLVHISRLADRYISDPHEVVSVGDVLTVWVVEIDKKRRRVSLTAIKPGTEKPSAPRGRKKEHAEKKKPTGKPAEGSRRKNRRTDQKSGRKRRAGKEKFNYRPKPKPKPVVPITKKMREGSEPMRTFGDLLQFMEEKPAEESKSETDKKN